MNKSKLGEGVSSFYSVRQNEQARMVPKLHIAAPQSCPASLHRRRPGQREAAGVINLKLFNVPVLMWNQKVKHPLISMGLSQGDPEQQPVLSKVEARQGVTGHNVRYVLWFGLTAVIVAFATIYFFYFD